MKLLLVSDAYPPSFGGVERHVYTLSKYLANKDIDVTVLTEKIDADDSELTEKGIKIIRDIPFDKRNSPFQWTYQFLTNSGRVKKAIEKYGNDFDLIHYHGTHMLYLDKVNIKPPLMVTIHGIFPSCIAFWGIEDWCGKEPTPVRCSMCMLKIRNYYVPFFPGMILYNKYYLDHMKKSFKSFNKVISVSDYVKNIVKDAFNLDNIITAHNFIDLNEILTNIDDTKTPHKDYLINEDTKIVLYSARLHPQKGITTVIDAFQKIDTKNIVLLISGKGELEEYIQKMSREHSKIIYLGFLPRDVQLNILKNSDVFLAPSTYPDACPTSILEATALGVPVISTSLGGIPELIIDGETGYLIDPNNPEQLAQKINEVLMINKEKFQTKCRTQAEKFDIENIGVKIIKIYSELLDNS